MLVKVANKETNTVVSALIKQAKKLPTELYQSLTWDRGKELADHRRFSLATDIDVYFCDPQSPWQRGSNENTNGLLRQYFPKGTDLSVYSQAHLNNVARQLNERPRKTLGFETPAERFNACVASTDRDGSQFQIDGVVERQTVSLGQGECDVQIGLRIDTNGQVIQSVQSLRRSAGGKSASSDRDKEAVAQFQMP